MDFRTQAISNSKAPVVHKAKPEGNGEIFSGFMALAAHIETSNKHQTGAKQDYDVRNDRPRSDSYRPADDQTDSYGNNDVRQDNFAERKNRPDARNDSDPRSGSSREATNENARPAKSQTSEAPEKPSASSSEQTVSSENPGNSADATEASAVKSEKEADGNSELTGSNGAGDNQITHQAKIAPSGDEISEAVETGTATAPQNTDSSGKGQSQPAPAIDGTATSDPAAPTVNPNETPKQQADASGNRPTAAAMASGNNQSAPVGQAPANTQGTQTSSAPVQQQANTPTQPSLNAPAPTENAPQPKIRAVVTRSNVIPATPTASPNVLLAAQQQSDPAQGQSAPQTNSNPGQALLGENNRESMLTQILQAKNASAPSQNGGTQQSSGSGTNANQAPGGATPPAQPAPTLTPSSGQAANTNTTGSGQQATLAVQTAGQEQANGNGSGNSGNSGSFADQAKQNIQFAGTAANAQNPAKPDFASMTGSRPDAPAAAARELSNTSPQSRGGEINHASSVGPQSNRPVDQAARVAKPAPTRPTVPPKMVINQVAVQITKEAKPGTDMIRIQLRPEELGKVDVKIDLGGDGRVKAMVTVEKPETLDMLQRDARSLERALQDAGLKTNSDSLNFSLKDQSGQSAEENGKEFASGKDNETGDADVPENDKILSVVDGEANQGIADDGSVNYLA